MTRVRCLGPGVVVLAALLAACDSGIDADLASPETGRPATTDVTLAVPAQLVAGQAFAVEWSGPDNSEDLLAFIPADSDRPSYQSASYVRRGNPLFMRAPRNAANYRLAYIDGGSGSVLNARQVRVVAAPEPGYLKITVAPEAAPDALMLLLDLSSSMQRQTNGRRRVDILRLALHEVLSSNLVGETALGLRAWGQTRADDCVVRRELALGHHAPAALSAALGELQVRPRSRRAAAAALASLREGLGTIQAPRVVLFVNGEDTCSAPPALDTIAALKTRHPGLRLDVIGFGIDEHALARQYAAWAEAGAGRFIGVENSSQLTAAIAEALLPGYWIYAADGDLVASAAAGGEAVSLPPGAYVIRRIGPTPGSALSVNISTGQTLEFAPDGPDR